jgi:hypothetical protein
MKEIARVYSVQTLINTDSPIKVGFFFIFMNVEKLVRGCVISRTRKSI